MPVITVQMGNPHLNKSEELIKELTATAARVLGAPNESFTIFIEGYELGHIGSGGITLGEKLALKGHHS